jgi:hypothetical protein
MRVVAGEELTLVIVELVRQLLLVAMGEEALLELVKHQVLALEIQVTQEQTEQVAVAVEARCTLVAPMLLSEEMVDQVL